MKAIEPEEFGVEQTLKILKSYHVLKRHEEKLVLEIKGFEPPIDDKDIIESMTFPRLSDGYVQSGRISDKTGNIAGTYTERALNMIRKTKQDLENELRWIITETRRIESYIGLLEPKQSQIIKLIYLQGLSLRDAAAKAEFSESAAKKYRKIGIDTLTEMFSSIIRRE